MNDIEQKIEKILLDKILDITDEYKGMKREEGVQVYLGYPKQLITELTLLIHDYANSVIGSDEWVDPDMIDNKPEQYTKGPEDPVVKPWTRNNLRAEQRARNQTGEK